jgi:hypothetical protein
MVDRSNADGSMVNGMLHTKRQLTIFLGTLTKKELYLGRILLALVMAALLRRNLVLWVCFGIWKVNRRTVIMRPLFIIY